MTPILYYLFPFLLNFYKENETDFLQEISLVLNTEVYNTPLSGSELSEYVDRRIQKNIMKIDHFVMKEFGEKAVGLYQAYKGDVMLSIHDSNGSFITVYDLKKHLKKMIK